MFRAMTTTAEEMEGGEVVATSPVDWFSGGPTTTAADGTTASTLASSTVTVSHSTMVAPSNIDGLFIGSMVCAAAGIVLLLAGFIRLGMWAHSVRIERQKFKRRLKQLRYMKYLEEYSIKTGGSPNEYMSTPNGAKDLIPSTSKGEFVFDWEEYGVNPAFISDETLKRHSPKIKLEAHMNGSAGLGRKVMRHSSQPGTSNGGVTKQASVTSPKQNGDATVVVEAQKLRVNNNEEKTGNDDASTASGDTQTTEMTSELSAGSYSSDMNKVQDVEF